LEGKMDSFAAAGELLERYNDRDIRN
jgi:hypothetical protein